MGNQEIYQNRSMSHCLMFFEPVAPMNLKKWGDTGPDKPEEIMAPLEYLENDDVVVRFYAAGAREVRIVSNKLATWKFDVPLQDRGNGIFEGVIPTEELGLRGNVVLSFLVDGSEMLSPHHPVQVANGKLVNYIEVSDPETPYILLRDVPHGAVRRELIWSESIQNWIRCLIYTPPGYDRSREKYPVLYLQHGAGENETAWVNSGKLPYIMDKNIADGKARPFVVVMNNGMLKAPHESHINDFDGIEGIITEDCRKYVERNYRVRTDRDGRAIAGLSLGSMQAMYIGLRHPELYSAIGSFTYMRLRDRSNDYGDNPHLDALKDPEKFWSQHQLLFRSIGDREWHLDEFQQDDAFLSQYGIDQNEHYVRKIYPGQIHNWNCWRRAFNDFSTLVFQWEEQTMDTNLEGKCPCCGKHCDLTAPGCSRGEEYAKTGVIPERAEKDGGHGHHGEHDHHGDHEHHGHHGHHGHHAHHGDHGHHGERGDRKDHGKENNQAQEQ